MRNGERDGGREKDHRQHREGDRRQAAADRPRRWSREFCEGHILLEDVPGVAKTMLARALAPSVGCTFKRIQCTPDLLPTDVTGVSIFNPKTTEFEFRPGPIFAQIVLADEINRATPRTQAALLEAMAERRVTVDGKTYTLEPPFLVIATQNPIDHEGTFPLPEAQLDRFLMRLSLGYPDHRGGGEDARAAAAVRTRSTASKPVVSAAELVACQEAVREVHVDDKVRRLHAARSSTPRREHEDIALGGSPRASIALFRTAQALAAVRGRDFVLPDDVKRVVAAVLAPPPDPAARKPAAQGDRGPSRERDPERDAGADASLGDRTAMSEPTRWTKGRQNGVRRERKP